MRHPNEHETPPSDAESSYQNEHAANKVRYQNIRFFGFSGLFSKWAGIVALLISIAVGIFTVVDQTLIAPDVRRDADLAKLDDIIVEIGKANVAILMQPNNVSSLFVAQKMNSIKLPLLESAVNIIEKYPKQVDAATLVVTAGELIQAQNYDLSLKYATMARDKGMVKDIRIEATRMMAVSNMGVFDEIRNQEARDLFEETINLAKSVESVNGPWLVSNALRDWAIQEILLGNCAEAGEVFARFATDIPIPIGRAAASTGILSVVDTAQFAQICSREVLNAKVEFDKFGEATRIVFPRNMTGFPK